MRNLKKDIIQGIKIVTLALMLSVGVSYVFAANWTAPLSTPPNCVSGNPGCDAPVHVGTATQEKAGALRVNGFRAFSVAGLSALFDGKVGIGTGSDVLDTSLTVKAGGVNGIKLAPETGQTQNSGRLFFSNIVSSAANAFAVLAVNNNLEFRYGATPGSVSGTVGLSMSKGSAGVNSIVSVGTPLAPGSIKIVDGTQGAGKVLTSDATGLARWTPRTSTNAQDICIGLGGTWTGSTCNFTGGPSSNAQTICTSLGGSWDGAKCIMFGGNGGSGPGGGSVTNIIGGTTNTINVTNPSGPTVTIDADMEGICVALGGNWNAANSSCAGIGSGSWLSPLVSLPRVIGASSVVNIPFNPTYVIVHSNNSQKDDSNLWNLAGQSTILIPGVDKSFRWYPRDSESPRHIGFNATWSSNNQLTLTVNSQDRFDSGVTFELFVSAYGAPANTGQTGSTGVSITCPAGQAVKTINGNTATCTTDLTSGVTGAVSIGGGGWESIGNNSSVIVDCTPWGGATCTSSHILTCPAGFTKVMTGEYEQKSDIPSHHRPLPFASYRMGAGFICYK